MIDLTPRIPIPEALIAAAEEFGKGTAVEMGYSGFTPNQRDRHKSEIQRQCENWADRQQGSLPPQKQSNAGRWLAVSTVVLMFGFSLAGSNSAVSSFLVLAGAAGMFVAVNKAHDRILGPHSAAVRSQQVSWALSHLASVAADSAQTASSALDTSTRSNLAGWTKNRWTPIAGPPLTASATADSVDIAHAWLLFLGLPRQDVVDLCLGPRGTHAYEAGETSEFLLYVNNKHTRMDVNRFQRLTTLARSEGLQAVVFSSTGFTAAVKMAANDDGSFLFSVDTVSRLLVPCSDSAQIACEHGLRS